VTGVAVWSSVRRLVRHENRRILHDRARSAISAAPGPVFVGSRGAA
jgi:hypothetical protein